MPGDASIMVQTTNLYSASAIHSTSELPCVRQQISVQIAGTHRLHPKLHTLNACSWWYRRRTERSTTRRKSLDEIHNVRFPHEPENDPLLRPWQGPRHVAVALTAEALSMPTSRMRPLCGGRGSGTRSHRSFIGGSSKDVSRCSDTCDPQRSRRSKVQAVEAPQDMPI